MHLSGGQTRIYERAVSNSFLPQELLAALIEEVDAGDLVFKFYLSSLSILIWDWLLTLNLEIRLVWPNKLSLGKVLFFLTRYLPFVDILVGLVFTHTADAGTDSRECKIFYGWVIWLEVIGINLVQVVLILRTWALYGRNKWVLAGLLVLLLATVVFCGTTDQILVNSIVWAGPTFTGISGCVVRSADNLRGRLAGNYISVLALETIILLVLMFRAAKLKKVSPGSPLITIIYQDGLIFYFFVFVISIVNVVTVFTVPQAYCAVLILFQRAIHSVAASRILLNIRQVASKSHVCMKSNCSGPQCMAGMESSQAMTLPPLQFASCSQDSTLKIGTVDEVSEWFGDEHMEKEQ
ncbi:hypothetical protein DL96DRAFT_1595285 [Flagelloscypha sp. PMI_526]|nr:hypothetical protein DL96DRAFT_1595285 [Flagelloscypha sp. PMI_526]